ncbi:MAG: type II toxin-antitoxin system Phd/YefM family antitoxin [Acidaminococcaceae bacterium]|nr:type II toxin-antitoxin system Phd/YefM family antitoxin [Acidaminococcaceae bacterium]
MMSSLASAITNTVAITQFNRGLASKIFKDVKSNGAKVVMKNNVAECVLMSPEQYMALIDEVNDARLLATAIERTQNINTDTLISEDESNRRLGITEEDLKGFEEVEIG